MASGGVSTADDGRCDRWLDGVALTRQRMRSQCAGTRCFADVSYWSVPESNLYVGQNRGGASLNPWNTLPAAISCLHSMKAIRRGVGG